MSISQLSRDLSESATLRLNKIALNLRELGQPIIHLGGGEPKTKMPIGAVRAASAKITSANVRYTPEDGTPELKKAIIRYTEDHYNKEVSPENVIASNGAKQSLSVLMQAILNPQDEVIINSPYWVSYPDMAKICYAKPIIIRPESGRFHPTIGDIENAITSYTKLIIINSPSNPTGVLYSEKFIKEIIEFAEKKGIYLVMDDIYNRLIFDGKQPISAYKFSSENMNKTKLIIVNGISKIYAMTGFRLGYTLANPYIVKAMSKIQGHTTSCPSSLTQAAAVGALNGVQSGVESLRLTLENNRNILMQELNTFEGVHVRKPDGTFYSFPDFSNYNKDSEALSNFLLEKVQVVTVPGKDFGAEGHLRISFCGSIKEIREGIARIKWALGQGPNEIMIGERRLVRDWV
ncbi:MAG: Aspartate aminotransferase [Candidatus Heimdallarchaeota archaeon LC_3]|nr:MAG: Aspartate aminotransferase [Candidatus Heimdallarchaeota archaeon LC_3]